MSHYNHAQVVVIAKVVKIGNGKNYFSFEVEGGRRKSYFMKLKIIKTYKNSTVHTKEIIVGKSPNDYASYEKGKTYLIHAYPHVAYDFLLVNQGVDLEDEEGMRRYDFMDQIPQYHTGEVKEFSTYGRLRAKGKLVNGLPEGEWLYYGYSGELQIKGAYQNGEETGLWEYYHHTEDRAYELLQKIYSGAYYEWSQNYKPIQLDTNLTGQYRKRIIYMVDSQAVTELFYYNQRIPQKIAYFKEGELHGIEKTMTLNGTIHTQYSFEEGILDGAYFTIQPLPTQEGVTLRVEGEYRANQKYMETHFYYEKERLFQTKMILNQGKLVD
jgi:antitoxin component YwqK of YwqJK toxin-antitoxin module